MLSFSAKTKRAGHQVGEKQTFFGQTGISGRWGGRGVPKFGRVKNFYLVDTHLKGFLI